MRTLWSAVQALKLRVSISDSELQRPGFVMLTGSDENLVAHVRLGLLFIRPGLLIEAALFMKKSLCVANLALVRPSTHM